MSIRFVIVNCDLYFHMHIYDNNKYMHIWCTIFIKEIAPLFLFYSRFHCFFFNSCCTHPVSVLLRLLSAHIYWCLFSSHTLFFSRNHIKCSYWLWLWGTKVLVACKTSKIYSPVLKFCQTISFSSGRFGTLPFQKSLKLFWQWWRTYTNICLMQ